MNTTHTLLSKLILSIGLILSLTASAQSEGEKEITEDQVLSTVSSSLSGFNLVGKTVMTSNLNKPCLLTIKENKPHEISLKLIEKQNQPQTFIFGEEAEGAKFMLKMGLSQTVIKQDFSDSMVKLTIEKPAATLRFVKMETIGAGEETKTLVCVFDRKREEISKK